MICLWNPNYMHSFEVVGGISQTHIQVGEHSTRKAYMTL